MLRLVTGGVGLSVCIVGSLTIVHYQKKEKLIAKSLTEKFPYPTPLPTRSEILKSLRDTAEFDVLVIGGGATGCGVALDAATRGLKTALVERDDYSAGASSRSTKLIHGGVRYLQKALMRLDRYEYMMVKEALHERAVLLANAPHIATALPIMLPIYKWWEVPYFWVGLKVYDLVAGRRLLKSSYFIGRQQALEEFPMLKTENLCGALVYYDGQHNDSRMNLAIALTAIRNGASCANHVEVIKLLTEKAKAGDVDKEVVCGARVKDSLTGEEWDVRAKCVVNATGPFTDSIRQMANKATPAICQPSSGVHVVLPEYYSPRGMGLLDPASSDGRVIFFLPWEGRTIAGTTDNKCEVTYNPRATEEEVQFVLREVQRCLNSDIRIRREDVLAAWSGIRPLVLDPNSSDTKSLSRNHMIHVSEEQLVTIAGGKWTTYRAMARDTVDAAVKACKLEPSLECVTDNLLLEGAEGWTPTLYIKLVQDFGIDTDVAEHLSRSYGTNAEQVVKLARPTGKLWPKLGIRLSDQFPFIDADVLYSVKQEYACTAVDVIARRLRIAFLHAQAAEEILPQVVKVMGDDLGWDERKRAMEIDAAKSFLKFMVYPEVARVDDVSLHPLTSSPTKGNHSEIRATQ